MNTVTIGVSPMRDAQRRTAEALRGKRQSAYISFASEDLLWKTLTPKRWAFLKIMAAQGPLAIREVARRDVRAVHSDIQTLLKAGVLDREEDGRVKFAYNAIHVDFVLHAAA